MDRAISEELKAEIRHCLKNLPITINTSFGDPFQPDQWENTLYKVRRLKEQEYEGEVEVSTKWIVSDEQIETLHAVNPDLWIMYGVTGLNEKRGISLEDRIDNYLKLCTQFGRTVLNIRPLIPGRNDSMTVLRPIIEAAARGNRLLKHGGYLDPSDLGNKKYKYEELRAEIHALCEALGVNDQPRCASIVTEVTGRVNSTYDDLTPSHLDVLSALGFDYELVDGTVRLLGFNGSEKVTKGDVSFAKLIVESSRVEDNWTDPHQYMQMVGPGGQVMACTSSWFHWAREVPCQVNCSYCHVRPGTAIYFEAGDSGCSPVDLYDHLFGRQEEPTLVRSLSER